MLGQNAAVKRGGHLMDNKPCGLVQVLYNGVSKNAPLGLIGCSVGADTVIGLGVAVAAGRAVPSALKVVMHPAQMLASVAFERKQHGRDQSRLRG